MIFLMEVEMLVGAEIQTKIYEKINEQKLSSSELNGKRFSIPIGFVLTNFPLKNP